MTEILDRMLSPYEGANPTDKKNAAKEVIQEIVLCGLSRAGFFDKAAFYGGTALRIFYGLDRFSEDLDFSLMAPDAEFDLASYFPILEKEVRSYGLNVEIAEKEKAHDSNIQSAFLKGNTREYMLLFFADEKLVQSAKNDEKIKVKFEVDVNPPDFATFRRTYRLLPAPYEVNMYDEPSLFAGKIHAVLCRGWKNRVKGRDLYDYLFYLSRGSAVNLKHLNARLAQTGFLQEGEVLDEAGLRQALQERFDSIDFKAAARDVMPFLQDASSLHLWTSDFFKQVTEGLKVGRQGGQAM